MSDLSDSKAIEADADLLGLIDRGGADDDTAARLIIAKQRDGPTGAINLVFEREFTRFKEAARVEEPNQVSNDP